MRRASLVPLLLLTAAAPLIVGCGSSSSSGTSSAASAAASTPAAAAGAGGSSETVSFPTAKGRALSDLRQAAPEGLILAPSVSVLQPGTNRYGFAIFDAARKQVAEAPVALYISRTDGSGLRGPYPAHSESLAVAPQYQSVTTSNDPDAAKSVYVAEVPFPGTGRYRVTAVTKLDGRAVSTSSFSADVTPRNDPGLPPSVGQAAPKVQTPTLDSVAGDAARISTRSPAAKDLLQTNLAAVYGKKAVALLFATPALCQSRVCGPVVDVMEQVRAETKGSDVAFITNEIYKENRVDQGLRPQPAAYRIPTEPWLFIIDRRGRIAERIEGAFSAAEMKAAIARVRAAG